MCAAMRQTAAPPRTGLAAAGFIPEPQVPEDGAHDALLPDERYDPHRFAEVRAG